MSYCEHGDEPLGKSLEIWWQAEWWPASEELCSKESQLFPVVIVIVVIMYIGYTVEYQSLAFLAKIRCDIAPPKSSEKHDFNKVQSKGDLLL